MPQGIQGSALGNQLRRAFGLRGLISTAVDEVLVPVGLARNLDAPPFRTDGVRWWLSSEQTAAAGMLPMISLVAAEPGQIVVDGVYIGSSTANAELRIGWGTDAWFPPNGGQSSELPQFDPANPVTVPVRLLVATVNDPYTGALPFWRWRGSSVVPHRVEVDQPINQGPQAAPVSTSMRFLNLVAASQLYVSVTGRYWSTTS